jgi:C4-dicarboxylate transporter DctM subunit
MTTVILTLAVSAIALLLIGMPIAYALSASGVFALMVKGGTPLLVFPQRFFNAINSFSLMAIIFFVIAGELMMQGGISQRIVNFAQLFLGRLRGSLSFINFICCAFFGAISGSALATSAAIGGILYPEMIKDGDYDPNYAAAMVGVGGTLGLMIPPSICLILYGTLTDTSVGDLFLAIVVPGILVTLAYCLCSYLVIRKKGYAPKRNAGSVDVVKAVFGAVPALLTPVIILGGIYGGIFTPTESAIVASIYALLVGIFVYREMTWARFVKAMTNAAVTSAVIMFLIGSASFFGWVMTALKIPSMVSGAMMSVCNSKFMFLLIVNVLFLICGMLMETSTIVLLVVPLVFPVAQAFGVHPVHFGVITCTNLAMGMYTPPFGANIFLTAGMGRLKVASVFRAAMPLILTGILCCLLITYLPILSTMFL